MPGLPCDTGRVTAWLSPLVCTLGSSDRLPQAKSRRFVPISWGAGGKVGYVPRGCTHHNRPLQLPGPPQRDVPAVVPAWTEG